MARRPFFSGNYGSALGSTAQAADIIARAGQQRGQALAGMGAQIGGMIQQYGLNKQKRAELTDEIESAIKFNPEYLSRMTSTGDEASDKKAQTRIEKLSKGDLNMSELKGLAGDLAMMEKVDLRKQKEEDREQNKRLQEAIIKGKNNENDLYAATKQLKIENLKLDKINKTTANFLEGLTARKEFALLGPKLKTEIAELAERLRLTEDAQVVRSYYPPGLKALNEKEKDSADLGISQANQEKLEKENIASDEAKEAYSPADRAKAEKDQDKADLTAKESKNTLIPMRDNNGNIIPNQFTINNIPYTRSADGEISRIGTPSENIGPVRTGKAEELIKMGQDAADNYDVTSNPLVGPTAAGGDLGGMFEDLLLFTAGKIGLSGKDVDEALSGIGGAGLEEREVQRQKLIAINAQIKPTLVNAVNSRGPVYTQVQIDEEILAGPKQDNPTVMRRLREYPNLLNKALTEAETVVLDPEIKPGTSTYEKARSIVLNTPKLLKIINHAIGNSEMYEEDPLIKEITGSSVSPNQSIDSNQSSNSMSEMSDADLLKLID